MSDLHAETGCRYSVAVLCKLFGVSKQAYYKYDDDAAVAKAAREEFAVRYIKEVRSTDPGIGGVKLWYMYCREFGCDRPIGRDRFCRLIIENGLKVRQRIRKPHTTDSTHGLPTYPDLTREFVPTSANRLWVSDITYIMIMYDTCHYYFCYLSIVLDAYTEEIIGWSVRPSLDTSGPMEALRKALGRIEGKEVSLIHHSDRGCQYACREYVDTLRQYGIRISMTESGNPKDNAQAERVNNTMKNELLKGRVFGNIREVVEAVDAAVDFYNNHRPHMSIGMRTPAEMTEVVGDRNMKWHSRRREAILSKKESDMSDIIENSLPSRPVSGLPTAYGLQSTADRDKASPVNSFQ